MQAFRAIYSVAEDGFVKIKVPSSMGKRVEVILLPSETEDSSPCSSDTSSVSLHQNGFCSKVLAAKEEDVWNDL